MTARKGARSRTDVTPDILAALNAGTLESASLPETLVVDFAQLLRAVFPNLPASALTSIDPADGIIRRMIAAARIACAHGGSNVYDTLRAHSSDTVRGWATYVLAEQAGLTLTRRLELIRPLADDSHFGVREWAWMAIRPHLAADIEGAVAALLPWTASAAVNLRRFAVEVLRPRGVWCAHIAQLKESPQLGLPLLQPLHADEARYVQNSVANWLNDASKSQPEWVRTVVARWQASSNSRATQYICRRAVRSL